MARQVRVEILADARKFTKGMQDAQKSTQKFTDHTTRAGTALKTALSAVTAGAVIAGLKSTVDAASSLNETISKTRVVFGPAAKGVEDFSKRAATSLGLSRQEAEESAATFGNLFVSMKIGAPRAAEMSTKMVQLAGDLASFNNASPQETLEALRSGLVGETEPLRRFGINLNDADLRQKALSLGLVKTTKNVLPPAVKAQAAYALILEQSKTAQGDFSRTSNGLANQQRILAAQFKDLKANIGSALLPAVLKGVTIFNDFLGVVDRNRTAFGVLFGVLGTGAAVMGGLIVAAKAHKAVTEGVTAVTETWKTVQKGMNTVLGLTKTQALTTAAAENTLAASTTAAGTATKEAAVAGTGLAAGLGRLIPIIGLAAIGFKQYKDTTDEVADLSKKARQQAELGIGPHRQLGLTVAQAAEAWRKEEAATKPASKATGDNALATAYNAKQQASLRLEMVKALPQFQTQADKVALNAEKAKELAGKLQALKEQWKQQVGAVKDSILAYDGLISQSKVTAGQVVKDLHNQVSNFKTYSADVKRLIKAGVSQEAIQELSQKGPQYVHALATGSNTELRRYKQFWKDRQSEVKTSFATSMQQQFEDLVRKIKKMQAEINKLKGKTVKIDVDWTHPHAGLAGLSVKIVGGPSRKGRRLPGYGGGDRIPLLAEAGETVVSKEHSRLPYMRAAFETAGVPGYAGGGFVGTRNYFTQMRRDMGPLASRLGTAWGNVLRKPMFGAGGAADVNAVAQWTAAVLGRPNEWAAWARRIMFESGGRWAAVNRTDSNWLAGHPSVGGAQVIRGTFNRWAGPYRGVGPFLYGVSVNPRANSYAGGNYAIHRYGSLRAVDPRVRPIGYDRGGLLPPGVSMVANNTGRTEPVGFDYDKLGAAIVKAFQAAPPVVAVDDIHAALLSKKNGRLGGMRLGLT